MIKRIQLFVNRYYEAIKLTLLIILLGLAVLTIMKQLESNDQASIERTRAVAQVAESVKRETEAQTEIINKQFRAICIVIVETSGQSGLDKLDPDSRARCENLQADNPTSFTRPPVTVQNPPQPIIIQQPTQTPQQTPVNPQPPTENPQETAPPSLLERITSPVTNLLDRIL